MAENAVLTRHAEPLMADVRAEVAATAATAHVYGETQYPTRSWTQARRVIIKAEVVHLDGRDPRDNPRFVITNLRQTPQWIYEQVYCGRGEIENRIKELHHGLAIDRTSCSRFWANQLRVLLTAAAYVLMQELGCTRPAPAMRAPRSRPTRAAAQDRHPRGRQCAPFRAAPAACLSRHPRVADDRAPTRRGHVSPRPRLDARAVTGDVSTRAPPHPIGGAHVTLAAPRVPLNHTRWTVPPPSRRQSTGQPSRASPMVNNPG